MCTSEILAVMIQLRKCTIEWDMKKYMYAYDLSTPDKCYPICESWSLSSSQLLHRTTQFLLYSVFLYAAASALDPVNRVDRDADTLAYFTIHNLY